MTQFFFCIPKMYLPIFQTMQSRKVHRQPACLPTPLHFRQGFQMNLFVWDHGHPGCRLCSAESRLWQNALTHYMRVWYINPLSLLFPADHTNSSEYYDHLPPVLDPGVIFQVCIHVRAQCRETLTAVIWHVLCVVLQGKTMTACIWNMACKLHATQTVTLNLYCKFYSNVASPIYSIHT